MPSKTERLLKYAKVFSKAEAAWVEALERLTDARLDEIKASRALEDARKRLRAICEDQG